MEPPLPALLLVSIATSHSTWLTCSPQTYPTCLHHLYMFGIG
jgi:hypothetical protein